MEKRDYEKKRKIVVLTITEYCNLSCVYCFEKAKTKKAMNIEVAKSTIEYEFKNSDDFDEIEFDLFGGEPTLYFSLIKEIVAWTFVQEFQKPYLFFLETNGTLVHGEFQDWLLNNLEYVYAGLSLDGTPETHNKNRCNSYDSIDVDFFVKNYPVQSVRMTINNETISNLSNDIIYLHELGFSEIVAVFAYGIDWGSYKINNYLPAELEVLCNYYLAHPDIKECSIFDMNLPDIIDKQRKKKKWCGTGTTLVSYGVDGTKYPCHTFQPNTSSEIIVIKYGEIDFNLIKDYSDPECENCLIEPICANCYGMNFVNNGNIFTRNKQLCKIVKIRAVATSFLKAQQIERNIKQYKPNEMFQTIEAIKKIQSNLLKECS